MSTQKIELSKYYLRKPDDLSSDTNSDAENVAATPKAIKTHNHDSTYLKKNTGAIVNTDISDNALISLGKLDITKEKLQAQNIAPLNHDHDETYVKKNLSSASEVKNIVVTDNNNNVTIKDKIPYANLSISRNDIIGLGIPGTDTNTTSTAGIYDGTSSRYNYINTNFTNGASQQEINESINEVLGAHNTSISGKAPNVHDHNATTYKTTITANDYNIDINSTDISVTVKVTDLNNNIASQKNVTINISNGFFTYMKDYNGETTSIPTENKYEITGKTNISGEIILHFTPENWGLVTIFANNQMIQFHVGGIKTQSCTVHSDFHSDSFVKVQRSNQIVNIRGYIKLKDNKNIAGTGLNDVFVKKICTIPNWAIPDDYLRSETFYIETSNGHTFGHFWVCSYDYSGTTGTYVQSGDNNKLLVVVNAASTSQRPVVRFNFSYMLD